MDYEKLHKDTINKLQQMVNSGKITVETARGICADFVPESEYERIRKSLIGHLKECRNNTRSEVMLGEYAKWIAWLEKQGEQKPVIEMKTPEESLGISSEEYNKIVDECIFGEQKPAWSEEDEKKLNAIYSCVNSYYDGLAKDALLIWLKSLKDRVLPKQEWSEEDETYRNYILSNCMNYADKMGYVEEKNNRYLHQNAKDWLKSLKERIQPKPKQEWSEKDKRMLRDTIAYVEAGIKFDGTPQLNWLKSLRPQNTWKPSDEQLDALYDVLNPSDGVDKKALESLYEQLKAL